MNMLRVRQTMQDSLDEVTQDNPLPVGLASSQPAATQAATGQVSVATTATLIRGAGATRRSLSITNITGTQVVYIGYSNGVSTSNGDYLPASPGASITIENVNAVWGIAVTSAQTVAWHEEYE